MTEGRGFGLAPLKEEGTIDAHGKTYRLGDPGYDELKAESDARAKAYGDKCRAEGDTGA